MIGTIPAGVSDDVGDEGDISVSSSVNITTTDPLSHPPVSKKCYAPQQRASSTNLMVDPFDVEEQSIMKALLIIDMQVGCFAGDPPRKDTEGTVARINSLTRVVHEQGLVVFIQHTEASDGFDRGSAAWELLQTLDRYPQDIIVEKSACDSFLETELNSVLRNRLVTELIVVGCATDFCVDTTVRSAGAHGYKVIVPSDAHTTRDRPHLGAEKIIEHHNYMWADLLLPRQARVKVLSTATLLSELQSA